MTSERYSENFIMTDENKSLADLLFSEIPEVYEPDNALDRNQQILETIAFMRTRIPEEDLLKGEKIDLALSKGEFLNLIVATYGNFNSLMDVLFKDLCGYKGKGRRRRYVTNKKKRDRLTKSEFVALDISSIIYKPEFFYEKFITVLPSEIYESIGKPSEAKTEDIANNAFIQEKQVWLISELMKRNKSHIALVRNMGYAFSRVDDFYLNPMDFFSESDGENSIASCNARFMFGFLTSHIGYFNRDEHLGKWEELYSRYSCHTSDELIKRGRINELLRKEGARIEEVDPTITIENILKQVEYLSSVIRQMYFISSDKIESQSTLIVDQQEKLELFERLGPVLEERMGALEEELKAMYENRDSMQKQIEEQSQQLAQAKQKDVRTEYSELAGKLKAAEKGARKYQERAEHAIEKLRVMEQQLQETRGCITKFKRTEGEHQRQIQVLSDRLETSYRTKTVKYLSNVRQTGDEKLWSAVEEASRRLAEHRGGKPLGQPLGKSDNPTSYDSLKEIYPQADTFFKLKIYRFLMFYVIGGDHSLMVWAGDHCRYDREINKKTIRK